MKKKAPKKDALKPCPFCGGKAEVVRMGGGGWVRFSKEACGAMSQADMKLAISRQRWQRRVGQ